MTSPHARTEAAQEVLLARVCRNFARCKGLAMKGRADCGNCRRGATSSPYATGTGVKVRSERRAR